MNLSEMAEGALQEVVDLELGKVVNNIIDPNTDPMTPRKLQIEIKFKPGKNRDVSLMTFSVKSGLAPFRSIESYVHIGSDGVAREIGDNVPGQMEMDDNVLKINKEAQNG